MRFRKTDFEVLKAVDEILSDGFWDDEDDESCKENRKNWSSFFSRVESYRDKKAAKAAKVAGYSVRSAIEAAKGVLRSRLVLPAGKPSVVWFVQLQNRINASGLDEALIVKAATAAGEQWRGPVKFESLIRQADTLLAGTAPLKTAKQVSRKSYGEDDIDDL